uniref:LysR family transcriptional regulator n=1 Tax=Flavobacterium myungsuense TaxID=651823 RepID=UPI0036D2D862
MIPLSCYKIEGESHGIKGSGNIPSCGEERTITAAAKELRYVQSNITSRIQKLEEELNTPLFNRHHRGMTLTPEGKSF